MNQKQNEKKVLRPAELEAYDACVESHPISEHCLQCENIERALLSFHLEQSKELIEALNLISTTFADRLEMKVIADQALNSQKSKFKGMR